ASNERYVRRVAEYLGLFDGWYASNDTMNLTSPGRAQLLVEALGDRGFDYVGNDAADLAVWAVARRRIGIGLWSSVRKKLLVIDQDASILKHEDASRFGAWMKLLRL